MENQNNEPVIINSEEEYEKIKAEQMAQAGVTTFKCGQIPLSYTDAVNIICPDLSNTKGDK